MLSNKEQFLVKHNSSVNRAFTLLGGIAHILYVRFSGAQEDFKSWLRCVLLFSGLYSLPFVVVALGITAAALIPSLSETTQLSANTTFSNYLSDQSAQENFDNVQNNLKCCGVVAFTDYESIFNNLSVPVSCCNTTNPLANKTTCLEIVSNALQPNRINLLLRVVFPSCSQCCSIFSVLLLGLISFT